MARRELVRALQARYRGASRQEKGTILKELVAVSGFHRKHAIRLLRKPPQSSERTALASSKIYGEAVKQALMILWEAADRICGKRLKACLPQLLASMERHGHLRLETSVRELVLAASPATIDRLLHPVRKVAGRRRKSRARHAVREQVPVKTFADWKNPQPGHFEIDFVVHGGASMAGEYLHSLVVTDVSSGWVEAVALLAREQSLVVEGLRRIRAQLPMAMHSIDSDNDGAFLNETVADYCRREGLSFTRSRAYQKNDQAWIEQKNGAVVRKIVGHERLSGIVAGQALARLYQSVRLYVNFFQPSFKLLSRSRVGGKVRKRYQPPATPCERLLAHPSFPEERKAALRVQRDGLDPVELLHQIRQGQSTLAALCRGEATNVAAREDLQAFLSRLPELWKDGEVRPTHRKSATTRNWRTHPDDFAEVWPEVLQWIQAEPDATGKSVFSRLQEAYPGRFTDGQLRTLQRRISEWRRSMARELVIHGMESIPEIGAIGGVDVRPAGVVPLRLASLASATPPPQPTC